MYKKLSILFIVSVVFSFVSIAQNTSDSEYEEKKKSGGFKMENFFTGGSVGAGFGNGIFQIGVGPHFGYTVVKDYVDLAVSLNYLYTTQRFPDDPAVLRQSIVGPGAFVRVFPVNFFYVMAQYEQNFIKYRLKSNNSAYYVDQVQKLQAPAMLLGGGISQGREGSDQTYFYISLLFDVSKNINSPYTDQFNRVIPIIRTGVNIPLFQKRRND
jgi:hypothetical protein